jgi:glycosyltransferase involved in cell wall biosynthesis
MNQTYPVKEIIIIDDGSNLSIKNFINTQICCLDERIKFISLSQNEGPARARLRGIQESKYEWVGFLDSDDTWKEDKILKQVNYLQHTEEKIDLICTNATVHSSYGSRKMLMIESRILKLFSLLKNNFIINSSVLVRRDSLEKIGLYADDFYLRAVEDYATWLRIALVGNVYYLDDELVSYEDRVDSLSSIHRHNPRVLALINYVFWIRSKPLTVRTRLAINISIINEFIKSILCDSK